MADVGIDRIFSLATLLYVAIVPTRLAASSGTFPTKYTLALRVL